jgi:hypothetical protein
VSLGCACSGASGAAATGAYRLCGEEAMANRSSFRNRRCMIHSLGEWNSAVGCRWKTCSCYTVNIHIPSVHSCIRASCHFLIPLQPRSLHWIHWFPVPLRCMREPLLLSTRPRSMQARRLRLFSKLSFNHLDRHLRLKGNKIVR